MDRRSRGRRLVERVNEIVRLQMSVVVRLPVALHNEARKRARADGVSMNTVYLRALRHYLDSTAEGFLRVCQECGQGFPRPSLHGPVPKYCSDACRQAAHRKRHAG
jgi:hypothetical protein